MSVWDDIYCDGGVSESREIVVGPDDFLVFVDLDAEGVPLAGVAVSETGVAVRKALDAGEPCEGDAGQVLLSELPDDVAFLVYFENAVTVSCREEGVSIF
jgi:hypothetical protein